MHDRNDDDKYEESEYHFSDDDVSYDAEHEEVKLSDEEPAVQRSVGGNRSLPPKRILIGAVAFLAVVGIVYKLVAPTSTIPSTDISDQAITADAGQSGPMQANIPVTGTQQVAATTSQPTSAQPTVTVTAQQSEPMQAQVPMPSQQPAMAAQETAQQPAPVTQVAQAPAPSTTPGGLPMPGSSFQSVQASQATAPMPAPGASGKDQVIASMQQSQTEAGTVRQDDSNQGMSMPSMMPMPSAMTTAAVSPQQTMSDVMPSSPSVQSTSSAVTTMSPAVQAKMAELESQSQQLMDQMQLAYTQKITEFSTENKALKDQIQSLNSKVTELEGQLKQMMEAVTQQQAQNSASNDVVPVRARAADGSANYNVQAIIPGRAWLRSQNGETITVAEGDVIRDLGRITKIDPYDGVVEINTGNKMLSLSYGNVG